MLDFQRLEVYKVVRELRCELVALMKALPRGHAETLDQLNRASLSLKLNLAEGSGEYAPKEKAASSVWRAAPRTNAARCWTTCWISA